MTTGAKGNRHMRRRGLPHTKTVRVKGVAYTYFDTGQTDEKGRPIRVRMPDQSLPQFGDTYAALLAAKSRRANVKAEMTVPDLIDLYQRSPKFTALSDGSQNLYGIYLKQFAQEYPTAPAGKLARRDILRIVDKRAKKPGAANSLLRTIAALYKWARVRGHVENDPCKDVDELDVGEHAPWPQTLLDAAKVADDDRTRLAVHLLLYSAQRIGDVCKMRWSDIGRNIPNHLYVKQEKTGKEMDILIHDDLASELARHPKTLGTILAQANGRAIGQHTLRTGLQKFASDRGFKVVPHGLRKNAVNELLLAGCSVAETAAISGQSMAMIEHYAKGRAQPALGSAAVLKWQGRNK